MLLRRTLSPHDSDISWSECPMSSVRVDASLARWPAAHTMLAWRECPAAHASLARWPAAHVQRDDAPRVAA